MKKKLTSFLLLMAILLSLGAGVKTYASILNSHTHNVCTRDGGYEFVRKYTHSHYGTKDGREISWPCVVYDKYKRTERYCADCGMVIESLCYREYICQIHESAY